MILGAPIDARDAVEARDAIEAREAADVHGLGCPGIADARHVPGPTCSPGCGGDGPRREEHPRGVVGRPVRGIAAVPAHRGDDDRHAEQPREERDLDGHVDDEQVGALPPDPVGDHAHPLAIPLVLQRRPVQGTAGIGLDPAAGGVGTLDGRRRVVSRQLDPLSGPPGRRGQGGQPRHRDPQVRSDLSCARHVSGAVMVDVVAEVPHLPSLPAAARWRIGTEFCATTLV